MGMDLGTKPTKKGRHTPEMNVTPLVDVVLVLLIIFMVITPALSKQIWLHIPNEPEDLPAEAIDPTQPLVVSVNRDGDIRINRDVISDERFPARLTRILAARGERKVFFDANDANDFGRAAEALDLARAGGAATIAVMTTALPN